MKKAIFILLFFLFFTLTASASVEENINEVKDNWDKDGRISSAVEGNLYDFLKLVKDNIFSYKDIIKNGAYLSLVAVVAAISRGFKGKIGGSGSLDFAVAAAVVSLSLIPGMEAVKALGSFLRAISSFLTAFAPVYAGIEAASGKVISAGESAYFLLALSSIISAVTGAVVIPLLSLYLCLSSLSGVFSGVDITPFCEGIKKITNVILGLFSSLFSGFLVLKATVSQSADSVALRGIKFAAGNLFPVVGGALSEAISSAGGYLGVIKNSFGVFGIGVIFFTFLPLAANILLWIICLWIANSVAAAVGEESMVRSTKALISTFSLLWSISGIFFLLSVISIGISIVGGK